MRLGPEDLQETAELEAACFSLPWTLSQLTAAFAQKHFAAFGLKAFSAAVTQHEARLVAYISMYHNQDELEILNLAVRPEQRRQGHGRLLVRLAMARAAKMGIGRALLEVRAGNVPALALYADAGFTQIGLRRTYYADTGEDALIMECALPLTGTKYF